MFITLLKGESLRFEGFPDSLPRKRQGSVRLGLRQGIEVSPDEYRWMRSKHFADTGEELVARCHVAPMEIGDSSTQYETIEDCMQRVGFVAKGMKPHRNEEFPQAESRAEEEPEASSEPEPQKPKYGGKGRRKK